MLDLRSRRALLDTFPNPSGRLDYVVTLSGMLARSDGTTVPHLPAAMTLRYIPDRLVLDPDCLPRYLDEISSTDWDSVEAMAITLLDDLNNELVPRWINVAVRRHPDATEPLEHHEVVVEDRQPRWENRRLLDRMERY